MDIFVNKYTKWHNHRDTEYYVLYASKEDRDVDYDRVDSTTCEQVYKCEWEDVDLEDLARWMFYDNYIFRINFTKHQQDIIESIFRHRLNKAQ